MRKVTQISKAYCIVTHGFMSVDEKCLITDVIDILTMIIDHRVGRMFDNQQFKEQTQEVADFIDSIIYEIIVEVLDYFSVPSDDEAETADEQKISEDTIRARAEAAIYCEKAKAAGINVSKSEVDAWIGHDESQIEVEASLVPEG